MQRTVCVDAGAAEMRLPLTRGDPVTAQQSYGATQLYADQRDDQGPAGGQEARSLVRGRWRGADRRHAKVEEDDEGQDREHGQVIGPPQK